MMMFDEERARALAASARPVDEILGSADPDFMDGAISEIPRGAARGAAKVQGALTDMASGVYQPVLNAMETATGVKPWNPFDALTEQSDLAVRQFAPDPLTTGMAGQLVNGVADVMTQVGLGTGLFAASGGASGATLMAGGAVTAGGATGRATYNEMREKGVDPSTAMNAAFVDAVTTGAGVFMPAAIGYNQLAGPAAALGVELRRGALYGANMAFGAGANVATGIVQRGSTYELLKDSGYETMAEQFRPMEASSLAAEGILGAIFGVVGTRAGLPMLAEATADAALAARDAAHANLGTAPGAPADPDAATAHRAAVDEIIRADMEGRAPDLAKTGVQNANFVARPVDPTPGQVARAYYGNALPVAQRFSATTRLADVEPSARRALRFDAPELNEYAAHVEQQYGLPPGLINALKNAGERSNSNQVSPAGARGVMQFMPENLKKYGVTDASDPVQMIEAAGRYLRDTSRQYGGNIDAIIADYNGGPRQAREVLAGRQPKAEETRKYLARVREWLGRDTWAERTSASDSFPTLPDEQMRTAAALDESIGTLEAERADLYAEASQSADLDQVSAMRDELAGLVQQRQEIDTDFAIRARAKEIQASERQVSYKQARSRAAKEIATVAQDLDARIGRLESSVARNPDAAKALQRLADLDAQIEQMRENRAAVDAPGFRRNPVSAALNEAAPAVRPGERAILRANGRETPVEFVGLGDPGADGRMTARVRVNGVETSVPVEDLGAQPVRGAAIDKDPNLSPEESAIHDRFAEATLRDVDAAMRAYDALPETMGGKIVNTDLARELSPDYLDNRLQANAVHEVASWIAKERYRRALAEPDPKGLNQVTILAGGGGSGKSTALAGVPFLDEYSQVVLDTTLSNPKSARASIDAALEAGKRVAILFVARDPMDAFRGVISRAKTSGRPVPISAFARAHEGAAATVRQLTEHYADDARVEVLVYDNSGAPGTGHVGEHGDLSTLDKFNYNELATRAHEVLSQEIENGTISPELVRALRGASDRSGAAGVLPRAESQGPDAPDGSATGSQHAQGDPREPGAGGGDIGRPAAEGGRQQGVADDIETRAGLALLEEQGDIVLPALDENGNEVNLSLRQALVDADAESAYARPDTFEAAILCHLKGGA